MAFQKEISLGDAIEQMLKTYKLKSKLQEAQLVDCWADIVGKMIEKHTRDIQLKNKKLFIKLDSPVVRQELTYSRSKIMEKVNLALGGNFVEEVILI